LGGYSYTDKDDHKRTNERVAWWKTDATTLRDIVRLDPSWQLCNPNGEHPPALEHSTSQSATGALKQQTS